MISELGKNIKFYRTQKGWSLNKLKIESNVGYATLYDIENGKSKNLNSDTLQKIATALDVTTNELIGKNTIELKDKEVTVILKEIYTNEKLTLDNKKLSEEEKEIIKKLTDATLDTIRIMRRRN